MPRNPITCDESRRWRPPASVRYAARVRHPGRDPALLLALLLAVFGATRLWDLGERSPGIDFYQFWVIAQVAGQPETGNIYDETIRARIGAQFLSRAYSGGHSERRRAAARARAVLEPFSTPFLYAVFSPLVSGRYEADYRHYRAVSLLCVLVALLVLGHLLELPARTSLLFVGLVFFTFQPLRADIRVGNVNQIQLAMLAAYLWLGARRDASPLQVAAGAALGFAVCFKPNMVAVVPLMAGSWWFDGRGRKLALQCTGFVVAAGAAIGAGAVFFGALQAWVDWFASLRTLPPSIIPIARGNFGLVRLLQEHLAVFIAPQLLVLALAVAIGALWRGRVRPVPDAPDGSAVRHGLPAVTKEMLVAGAGCLVYLVCAPLVWQHYLLFALPSILGLLHAEETGGERQSTAVRWTLAGVAFTAIAITPYAELLQVTGLVEQALVATGGLLLLYGMTIRRLLRG